MPHRYRSAVALCCGLLSLLFRMAPAADFTPARIAVYFSPHGGATDAVVHEVMPPTISCCRRTASPRRLSPKP
jgi:hypothetical protein